VFGHRNHDESSAVDSQPPPRSFHEELAEYLPLPDEYYASWASSFFQQELEDAEEDDAIAPSLAFDAVGLGADIEEQVEYIADTFQDSVDELFFPDFEGDEEIEDESSDSDSDFEDEAFPIPKLPGNLPRPKLPDRPRKPRLPDKPKLPGKPKFPKRPPHPHPPHRRRPHFPGHHPHPLPHFRYINHTIYEFLANSTHHKILYKIVKNDSSLIDLLNQTSKDGKITLFAPTDRAFKKLIEHLPKNHTHPPKWLIRKVIEYHTIGSFYPAGRVLAHRTIPTLFEAHVGPNLTQRIRIGKSLRGVNINFYAHPVFLDIFTANGVVHAIDSILIPPPPTYFILNIFPTFFSTFFQALHQTGVAKEFFPCKKSSSSWTVFVPGNFAWVKIPLPITAFLFSPRGHRILTKLIEYHISPNETFYTDSLWKFHRPNHTKGEIEEPNHTNDEIEEDEFPRRPHWKREHYNTTLPTLIGGNATLHIHEFKFGPFVKIGINGRPGGIKVNDVLGFDGVLHVTDRIILPPRRRCHHPPHHKPGHGHSEDAEVECEIVDGPAEDEELTIENLKVIFNEE
jgi:uncharacterized surface protein with fasciclin (FAS1) repeats